MKYLKPPWLLGILLLISAIFLTSLNPPVWTLGAVLFFVIVLVVGVPRAIDFEKTP